MTHENYADCRFCENESLKLSPHVWPRFIVCQDCGNKRCPKAAAHWQACSGSNEPGQAGSYYGPEETWPKAPPRQGEEK